MSRKKGETKRGIKEKIADKMMGKMVGALGMPPEMLAKLQEGKIDPIDLVKSFLPLKIPLDIHITQAEAEGIEGIAIILIPKEKEHNPLNIIPREEKQ